MCEGPATETGDTAVLWAAVRAKDPAARRELARLVTLHCTPPIRKRARPSDVEDLVQEAQLSTLRFAENCERPPKNLAGFLKFRARGVLKTYMDRRRNDRGVPDLEIAATGSSLSAAEREEIRAAIESCISQLDELYRGVAHARYLDELDNRAAARRLGLRPEMAALRLFRARPLIAECLRRKRVQE